MNSNKGNVFSDKKIGAACSSPHRAPGGCTGFGFIGGAVSEEIAVSNSRHHFSLCDEC